MPLPPTPPTNSPVAWLTRAEGKPVPLSQSGSLCIGRSTQCDLVLEDRRISRRHALLHADDAGAGFWISDLGGQNGVYVNGHRIHHATRLRHGDAVRLLDFEFRFCQPGGSPGTEPDASGDSSWQTMPDCRIENRWLLVADLQAGTRWASAMSLREFPRQLDRWFSNGRRLVERHRGAINNYAGDGFLADWMDGPKMLPDVAAALGALIRFQRECDIPFRMALHFGEVTVSGVGTVGKESLLGPEVNYVFRMEKVAAQHGLAVLLSRRAGELLLETISLLPTPHFDVPSFGADHEFYTIKADLELEATRSRLQAHLTPS